MTENNNKKQTGGLFLQMLPLELLGRAFQFLLPLEEGNIQNLRKTSKHFSNMLDSEYDVFNEKSKRVTQKLEIDYLLENKETILKKIVKVDSTLILHQALLVFFEQLARSATIKIDKVTQDEHVNRERYLNGINSLIIRSKMKLTSQYLYCNSCYLTRFPDFLLTWSESAEYWSQLRFLELKKNRLRNLPESMGKLANLKELYLQDNQLNSLFKSIGKLVNLKVLILKNNQLSSLPESTGELVKLRNLDLRNNKLSRLLECTGKLTKLRRFYLDNNQLQHLPNGLRDRILYNDCGSRCSKTQVLASQNPILALETNGATYTPVHAAITEVIPGFVSKNSNNNAQEKTIERKGTRFVSGSG